MKTDSRIIISIDKQFYSENDEIRIHVWFNHNFYTYASLTVLSPSGFKIDSSRLQTDIETTETFAFTCGGTLMFENGHYVIRVECDDAISERTFEYYSVRNRFRKGPGK